MEKPTGAGAGALGATWTRRRFVAATLAGAAAAATTGGSTSEAAPAAGFALAPDVRDRWAVHRDGEARLVQLRDGVRLATAPAPTPDRNGVATWSRSPIAGDFRVDFVTRRRDANPPPQVSGLFLLLYFGVRGDGSPGHPSSVADWPADTLPYSHSYAPYIKGARVALYRQFRFGSPDEPGSTDPIGLDGTAPLSAAYFGGAGGRTIVPGDTGLEFPGLGGETYAWTVQRTGDVVRVTQRAGDATRSVTYRSPGFGRYAGSGGLGFLAAPGLDVEVRGLGVLR